MAVLKGKVNGAWQEINGVNLISNGTFAGITVIAALDEPPSPAEQTVWVKTSIAVPKWTIQPDEPASPTEGQLWLAETYLARAALIAITQTHEIHCSVSRCMQYTGGEWVRRECTVYKGGEWKETGVYWFEEGAGYNSAHFGALYLSSYAEIAEGNAYIRFKSSPNTYPKCSSQTALSAGTYNYLVVDAEIDGGSGTPYLTAGAAVNYTGGAFSVSRQIYSTARTVTVIDISAAGTDFYPLIQLTSGSTAKIYNVWLM